MTAGGNPDGEYGERKGLERLRDILPVNEPVEVIIPKDLTEEERAAAEELRKSIEKMEKDRAELLADKKKFGEILRNASNTDAQIANTSVFGPSRNSAREVLTELQFNVDYLTGVDSEGQPEVVGEDLNNRLSEVQEVARELVAGGEISDVEKTRRVLEVMGVDDDVVEKWAPIDKVENLIQANEDIFRELFFADFDQDTIRLNRNECKALWDVFYKEEVLQEILASGFQYSNTPEGNFALLREAYMQHIFGEDSWSSFKVESDKNKHTAASLNDPDSDIRELAAKTLGIGRRTLESKINSRTRLFEKDRKHDGRNWMPMESGKAINFLLKHFEVKEISTDNNYDLVVRVFGTKYLEEDYIRTDLDKTISESKEQALLKSIVKVHELAVNLDLTSTKVFENIKQDYVEGVDAGILNVLSLKKEVAGREISIVPLVMEEYDGVLREKYSSGNLAVNIDSPDVFQSVERLLQSKMPNETERRLVMKMARDLCRITGLDAQFGYSRDDKKIKLGSTVRGSFLRGLMCFNDNLRAELSDEKQVLATGIDIGAYSFWNKMRGDASFRTDILYADEIEAVVRDKLSAGETHFANWLNGLKKPSEAKKAESDFIESPTISNFVSNLVEAYGYKEEKRPEYLRNRLSACIPYFKRYGEGPAKIIKSVTDIFMKDGNFDGKNIFDYAGDLKSYFNGFGIPINTTKAVLEDDSRKITSFLDNLFNRK